MNRKLEKRLMMVGGIWGIIVGLLTIFLYASYYKREGFNIEAASFIEAEAIQSVAGSLYMFIISFGILFIIVGMINIYLSTKIRDNEIEKKIPTWSIVLGIISYLLMDIIGGILFLTAGLLALAKNKSIAKLNTYPLENV